MQENVTVSGVAYTSYPLSVRVNKVTSTGQVTVGLAYKLAGSRELYNSNSATWDCNPNGFTSGDGHYGFLCKYDLTAQTGTSEMYFVSGDGTVRPLWTTRYPNSSTCYTNLGPGEVNSPQFRGFLPSAFFMGQTDAKTSFFTNADTSGSSALFKVVYSSDASPSAQVQTDFSGSYDGNAYLHFSPCDFVSITDLTPVSSSQTIIQLIEAAYPSYSTTTFGTGFSFSALSGKYAYFGNSYSGQDKPAWIAVFDISGTTATVVNLINTLDGTGTGGRMMWGGHHTLKIAAPNGTAEMVENSLTFGSSSLLFSGPFIAQPIAMLLADGVSYSTYTTLQYPNNPEISSGCPHGNPYEYLGATDGNCVTFKFPAGGVCSPNPKSSAPDEAATWPCPWHAGYSQPVTMAIGNTFCDRDNAGGGGNATLGEHMRIVQAPTTNGDGTLKVIAQRNAMPDGCCYQKTINGIHNCDSNIEILSYYVHPTSWTALMTSPSINGCFSDYLYLNSTDSSIYEESALLQGHVQVAPGVPAGNVSLVGASGGKFNLPFAQGFAIPTTYFIYAPPIFHGTALAIGGGFQAYTEATQGVPWMVDTNSINANFPGGPEAPNNNGGTITISTITTSISSITIVGVSRTGVNYKTYPMIGWAGRFVLKDVSGPGSLVDNTPYSMCFALNAGECHGGSLANDVYTNVPETYNSGFCSTGQSWLLSPCVILGTPGAGAVRQQRITSPDPFDIAGRFTSYGWTSPGQFYPFATAMPLPDASAILVPGHQTQQWGSMGFLMQVPPWVEDSVPKNDFINIPVKLSTGAAYAEVRFGYNTSLQCTTRNEACTTAGTAPFSFISESRTLTSCSLGCTINIPTISGNILYYQVYRGTASDGSNEASVGEIQTVGIQ